MMQADAAGVERDEDLWETVEYRPEGFPVPSGLRETVEQIGAFVKDPVLVELDLDQDGGMEYALLGTRRIYRPDPQSFQSMDRGVRIVLRSDEDEQERLRRAFAEVDQVVWHAPTGFVIRRVGGDWKYKSLHLRPEDWNRRERRSEVVLDALRQGSIETIAPELHDFRVGRFVFDISDVERWSAPDTAD